MPLMEGVRVLVVDAVPGALPALADILGAAPGLRFAGSTDGRTGVQTFLARTPVDVVVMDHRASRESTFEVTRHIMETHPLPIVISSHGARDTAFRALEAGAVACVEAPDAGRSDNAESIAKLCETVRLMAEVRVVRRWVRPPVVRSPLLPPAHAHVPAVDGSRAAGFRIVGIGASTGGPLALQGILAGLPAGYPLPVLVVQHIARGFLPGMVDWLQRTAGPRIAVAAYDTVPQPGHVYIAPDDFHMGIGAM